MPEDKNAHPTSTGVPTTVAAPLSKPEVQLTFHQHLREQIRSAVQTVMEEVMREELTQFLGAAWGETTAAAYRSNRRVHHGNELPHHCLGRDAGHSVAQNSSWLRATCSPADC